jgi:hypothetical protein
VKQAIRNPTVIVAALVTTLFCLVGGISATKALASSPPAPASPTTTYACIGYNSHLGQRVIFGAYTTLSGYQAYLSANDNGCPLGGFEVTLGVDSDSGITAAEDADTSPAPASPTTTYACIGYDSQLGQRVIFGAYTTLAGYQAYLEANDNLCPLGGFEVTLSGFNDLAAVANGTSPVPASSTTTYACVGYDSGLGQRVIFGAYTTLAGYQAYLSANSNECPLSGFEDTLSATPARDADSWPFTYDSIWNIPIASTATYAAAGITSNDISETADTSDYDSTNPSFPVVSLTNANTTAESPANAVGNPQTTEPVNVYGDPGMTAGDLVPTGDWNTCSAWLGTDGKTVYQGQTTEVNSDGDPYFGGAAANRWGTVQIDGEGVTGCHGGSGLSGLGGTLTLADLNQSGPITHALKVALDGVLNYYGATGGFRWPAVNADGGYNVIGNGNYYGGTNPNVEEGSLLALPPSISPSSFSNPTVQKIATALQDYGAYIVDTSATAQYDNSFVITNYNAAAPLMDDVCGTTCNPNAFPSQLNTLLTELEVVTNNTASTPGGGAVGASRCAPYAPQFIDGTDAPSSVPVVSC